MLTLSSKVFDLPESQTIALTAAARRLKEAGVNVVSLAAGEPDFPTPTHVKEEAVRALAADFTRYTENQGIPDLIDAIRWKFSRENDLSFAADQILVSSGAKHSLFNALLAICNPGDEVIILAPYWVSYPPMVRLADAIPVIVPSTMDQGFLPDPEDIRRALSPRTKALILNTPGNPSGRVYPRPLLEEIAAIAARAGIFVLSDEIYEKVVYDGHTHFSIGSVPAIRHQVVTVNGLSKAFAMPGWRIGYLGGPRDVVAAAAKVQSQTTSNANSIAQKAAVAALRGPTDQVAAMISEFRERRMIAHRQIDRSALLRSILPEGAIYLFIDVKKTFGKRCGTTRIQDSHDLSHHLLERYHVAVVPGEAFGDNGCIRISYSCDRTTLTEGIRRITECVEELQ